MKTFTPSKAVEPAFKKEMNDQVDIRHLQLSKKARSKKTSAKKSDHGLNDLEDMEEDDSSTAKVQIIT